MCDRLSYAWVGTRFESQPFSKLIFQLCLSSLGIAEDSWQGEWFWVFFEQVSSLSILRHHPALRKVPCNQLAKKLSVKDAQRLNLHKACLSTVSSQKYYENLTYTAQRRSGYSYLVQTDSAAHVAEVQPANEFPYAKTEQQSQPISLCGILATY